MSEVADKFDSCPDTGWNRLPFSKQRCGSTARTRVSCGTWHASSSHCGAWGGAARQALRNSVDNCLTREREAFDWLAAGSAIVQQQALRDFAQAMSRFFNRTHGRPSWRKAGRREGFRIVAVKPGHLRRLSRKIAAVWVPKVGWVRFRLSRALPGEVRSYRVTCDRAGRWHVALAVIPPAIPSPGTGTGETVGVDRGVAVSAALSTDELLRAPRLSPAKQRRMRLLQRKLRRAARGSNRRAHTRVQIARLYAKQSDMRKDWCEKTSTSLARRFDRIRVEDLQIKNMTRSAKGSAQKPGKNIRQKSGLNREILASGWGRLIRRLEDKASGRRVNPALTSQRCSACGHIAAESRKSQALFSCIACAYIENADVNAAKNIAAGHAVTARGDLRNAGPTNREPPAPPSACNNGNARIPVHTGREDVKSFRP
jgi:putative transposase